MHFGSTNKLEIDHRKDSSSSLAVYTSWQTFIVLYGSWIAVMQINLLANFAAMNCSIYHLHLEGFVLIDGPYELDLEGILGLRGKIVKNFL